MSTPIKITEQDKAQVIYELRHEYEVIDLVKIAGIAEGKTLRLVGVPNSIVSNNNVVLKCSVVLH